MSEEAKVGVQILFWAAVYCVGAALSLGQAGLAGEVLQAIATLMLLGTAFSMGEERI